MDRHSEPATVRLAGAADVPRILEIYTPYIERTPVTFETCVPAPEEFAERMTHIAQTYPVLVAEADGRVVGYAYGQRQAARAAYDWNAEISIYLEQGATGCGTGTKLLAVLLELLRRQGVRAAYSRITLPNEASVRLHERLGFEEMGVQRRAGYRLGAWRDVLWLVKPIGDFEGEPAPLTPPCTDNAAVQQILAELFGAAKA